MKTPYSIHLADNGALLISEETTNRVESIQTLVVGDDYDDYDQLFRSQWVLEIKLVSNNDIEEDNDDDDDDDNIDDFDCIIRLSRFGQSTLALLSEETRNQTES